VGAFLVFIIKSTCCLAVFYLFYRLLLSRDTFHRFNRMALLGVIVFSIAIPFVQLAADEPVAPSTHAGASASAPAGMWTLPMPGCRPPRKNAGNSLWKTPWKSC